MDTTVLAVKAALVRGRGKLRDADEVAMPHDEIARAQLDRYAALFNARDWDGVRSLVAEDCRLDLVGKSHRRGKAVGAYFSRYERENLRMAVVHLEGRLALGVFEAESASPTYFILLDWEDGRVAAIRDFRYAPYIAREADWQPA